MSWRAAWLPAALLLPAAAPAESLVVEVACAGAAAREEAWIDEMSAVNVRKQGTDPL
jgi:hypothetical protein